MFHLYKSILFLVNVTVTITVSLYIEQPSYDDVRCIPNGQARLWFLRNASCFRCSLILFFKTVNYFYKSIYSLPASIVTFRVDALVRVSRVTLGVPSVVKLSTNITALCPPEVCSIHDNTLTLWTTV